MSILSSTHRGMNAPFTEELALKMGYTVKEYDLESGPVKKIWLPPERITENPNFLSVVVTENPLWSNQFGVFFNSVFLNRTHPIDKVFHMLMLEKYWTCEGPDELMNLYAVLATGYNPNNLNIEQLKEKYGIKCPF